MTDWSQYLGPDARTTGAEELIRAFPPPAVVEDFERVVPDGDGWLIEAAEESWLGKLLHRGQSVTLFQVPLEGRSAELLIYRATVRSEALRGRAYLEMWCRVNGREYFSKSFAFGHAVEGTSDWVTLETPFLVRPSESVEAARLNLAIEGSGKVRIKDVELRADPLA